MSDNVFYYSHMSSNDINAKAQQYLSRFDETEQPRGQPILSVVSDAPSQLFSIGSDFTTPPPSPPSDNIFYYQNRQTPQLQQPKQLPQPKPQAQPLSSSIITGTPRISNKIPIIEQQDIRYRDIEVKVAEIKNPGHFYAVMQEKEDEYNRLKEELKQFYQTNCFALPINVECYYAAMIDGSDEWGRVKILEKTGKFCYCLFIDEGVTLYLAEEKLFLLDDRFKMLPPRSFKTGLLGLDHVSWQFTITTQFKFLVLGHRLKAYIQSCVNDHYQCFLMKDDICVNDVIGKLVSGETI